MYPRISDFINDITGWELCLPIQSFGFFVALAFIAAYIALESEVKRKTLQGIFPSSKEKVKKGGPIKEWEILLNFVVFGVLGFKLGLMFEDYDIFCSAPQDAILSTKGSFPAALVLAFAGGGFKLYQYLQKRDSKVEFVEEEVGLVQHLGTITTIAFVVGILGAKVFHNLEYWEDFVRDPIGALTAFEGLTFYGGLICAGVAISWYVKKNGYAVLPFADAISPAMMLSYGVGRIGCQVAGDGDWGIDNLAPKPDWISWLPDWMWSYRYPHNVLGKDQGVAIEGCIGDFCNQLANPVYPTPFYEIVMSILIFAGLWMIRKRLPYIGQMTGIYLIFNGLERFFIEKIRVNAVYHFGSVEITQAEIISTVLVIAGGVLLYLSTVKWKKTKV